MIKSIQAYTIDQHPDPAKVFEWVRNNWYDLNNHILSDYKESLKVLQTLIGGDLDYAFSESPCYNNYIKFYDYNEEKLKSLNAQECPLTGVYSDIIVIQGIQNNDINFILNSIHSDCKSTHSDENLKEFLEVNEYFFFENGEFCS